MAATKKTSTWAGGGANSIRSGAAAAKKTPDPYAGAAHGTSMGSAAAWQAAAARLNAGKPANAAAPASSVSGPKSGDAKPIWTPDQLIDKATFDSQYKDDDSGKGTAILDLEKQVNDANTQKQYDTTTLAKNALAQQSGNADDAAARGIAQSSLRQAASYDIEAQRALQQGMIEDTFKSIQNNVTSKLQAIKDLRTSFYAGFDAQGAQQGTAATKDVVPDDPAASGGPAPGGGKPTTAQLVQQLKDRPYSVTQVVDKHGKVTGEYHTYNDGSGRRVFVANH
jgi:hypothetical protein